MKHTVNLLSVSVKIRMVFTSVWAVFSARGLHKNALNCAIAKDIVIDWIVNFRYNKEEDRGKENYEHENEEQQNKLECYETEDDLLFDGLLEDHGIITQGIHLFFSQ